MPTETTWSPSARYPDPAVQILDKSFAQYRLPLAGIERLATGMRWCEGPVWFGDGRFVLWSDIPNNRIMRWDEETGAVSVFRKPSNNANGNTRDRAGRLVTCEHDSRRVTRTEYDGAITVICDNFGGKKLNSPNDVVVKSDGSIWFTDPHFGILSYYEGHLDSSRIADERLSRRRRERRGQLSSPTASRRRTGFASRRTRKSSTSWNRAASRGAFSATTWPAAAASSPTARF